MFFSRFVARLCRCPAGALHNACMSASQALVVGVVLLIPVGCDEGLGTSGGGGSPAVPDISVTGEVEDWFRTRYYETQECTGYYDAPFEAIHFVVRGPDFSCPGATETGTCNGQFFPPDTINVGRWGAVSHELVHYFWTHKTGELDLEHASPWLETCA